MLTRKREGRGGGGGRENASESATYGFFISNIWALLKHMGPLVVNATNITHCLSRPSLPTPPPPPSLSLTLTQVVYHVRQLVTDSHDLVMHHCLSGHCGMLTTLHLNLVADTAKEVCVCVFLCV